MIVKHGKSIEITDQLSKTAAIAIAKWIGCYTVIYNQKTLLQNRRYAEWVANGKPADKFPAPDASASLFQSELPFLSEVPSQIRRNAGSKWFEAYSAYSKGVRSRPRIKPKHKKRNCYVTNELFDVQPLGDDRCIIQIKQNSGKKYQGNFLIGVVMPFPAKDVSKSLYISRRGNRYWLSLCHDKVVDVMTEDEIRHYAQSITDEELESCIIGYDLGVKRQVSSSTGAVFHLPESASNKINTLQDRRARYQRKYARRSAANDRAQKTSSRERTKGERKLLRKIARYSEKTANIKFNNSHHISKEIAENTPLIAAFEDIRINNMVKRPKPKKCEITGKWLVNGASAKRGLNRAIHSSNMGQVRSLTAYKLKDRGKLMVTVKANYSSQECSVCGRTENGNRRTQSEFLCLHCGYAANADYNASCVVKKRTIALVRTETFLERKKVKTVKVRRKKAHELASLGGGGCVRPAEQAVTDDALNSQSMAHGCYLLEARRL